MVALVFPRLTALTDVYYMTSSGDKSSSFSSEFSPSLAANTWHVGHSQCLVRANDRLAIVEFTRTGGVPNKVAT